MPDTHKTDQPARGRRSGRGPRPSGGAPKPGGEQHHHARQHQEDLLDEGIEESFPASDPVSVKHIT